MSLHAVQKPHVERSIAVYKVEKEAKLIQIKSLLERIEKHLHILRGLEIKGFLISLEDVSSLNKDAVEALVKGLIHFHLRLKVVAGFCCYRPALFQVLISFVEKTPLALFKSLDVMALAIGTSGVYSQATILVHADDLDNRQSIASTLISNNYFVILATSLDDVRAKMKDKDKYERAITHSYFGFMHENASIRFSQGAFIYEFRGDLNVEISKRVSVNDFEYRLSIGHKVFIFDLTRIYHMDMRAAYLFIEMEKLAIEAKAQICLVDIDRSKIDINAISILQKSSFWIFDTVDDAHEDEEIIEMIEKRKNTFIPGLSNDTIKMAPQLIAAAMQTLEVYEFKGSKKSPSKQIELQDLVALKPTICTGISFDGDYDGDFIFIFTQGISEVLIEHILGGFDAGDGEDFLDAMSEFTNSVSGKLKSNLHRRERCIHFGLPHSTALLTDLIPTTSFDKPAILMSFGCEGHSFYIALTSPIK
jgi:hypothetical protein